MRHFALTASLFALTAGGVQADDVALLLGNDRYERIGRVSNAGGVLAAQEGIESLGFSVHTVRNGRAEQVSESLTGFTSELDDAERVVVVAAGRFATSGSQSWLLLPEANETSITNVAQQGISVEMILTLLGDMDGQALLVLGVADSSRTFDPWLNAGIGDLNIPQGVTVAVGEPSDAAAFARQILVRPEADLAREYEEYDLEVMGFAPNTQVFMPERPARVPLPTEPTEQDTAAEDSFWEGASALDTVESYRNYLARYPNGRYADEAEAMITEILSEPNRDARLIEEALELSRPDRREIQRNLTILDYNTRGIDGIFGPGTRQAITNWQQENGYGQTSYLTRDQIVRLDGQATRRAALLEAEAERRQREVELQDRAFWEETGSKGDEAGLRTYLERYPDGTFSDLATTRLNVIVEEKRAAAEAEDRSAWDRASGRDTVESYQDYLSAYPEGRFVSDAQAKIAELTKEEEAEPETNAAREAEAALGLNRITRQMVEARLNQLELNPGEVDGKFNRATRRAIRNFQRNNELTVTGFLDEPTVIRLLTDAVTGN